MIDLVTMYAPGVVLEASEWGELVFPSGQPVVSLPSLRTIPLPRGLLLQGSLPKVLRGENVAAATIDEVGDTLRHLEKTVGIRLKDAHLLRVEVGATLLVEHPPHEYLRAWATFGRFRMKTEGNLDTDKLITGSREFIGYDKGKESKRRPLPVVFEGFHALRLELKYLKGKSLRQELGMDLSPWDLVKPDIWSGLKARWKEFYFRIPKQRMTNLNIEGLKPSEFKNALAHLGLVTFGHQRALSLLSSEVRGGKIRKQYAARMRTLIRELTSDTRVTYATQLNNEVDAAVHRL